jgi:hypothetical protein
VAFIGHRGGDAVLYLRAGGHTRGLLRGDAVGDPAFSPRGQRLAVTREVEGVGRAIWIYTARGTGGRLLTAGAAAGAEPTWAPNGRSLAYAAGPHGQRSIHVIGADGTGDRALTSGGDAHDPAWSRRGTIAFVQDGPEGEDVYSVPSRGGTPRRLTFRRGDDKDPAFSPDGRRIAFVRGRAGIWVMSRWGRHARKVVHVPGGVEQGVAWSPNGRRLLFAGGRPGARRVYTVRLNGKRLHPLSLRGSNGEDPDWRSVGHDPIIAAAGDIACPPTGNSFNGGLGTRYYCAMMRTSNLMLREDLSAVLALGDLQYPTAAVGDFYQSFHPTWGRLKPLIHPVPGNHEYRASRSAQGYFDYFNLGGRRRGPAGDRLRGGYYSFNVGRWHVVALNSNCGPVPGGCAMGSPQQRWLARDLTRHRRRCTLAFWHHPVFSSRAREESRGWKQSVALWQTLYDAGADVVLAGHQHFYERLAPMDAQGNLTSRGLRSFVVGTGGRSIDVADIRAANSVVYSDTAYGVLELTLHPRSYEWNFRTTNGDPFGDTGRAACH